MTEITEKDCPIKLPVHKHLIFPGRFNILDAIGHRIVRDIAEEKADFICLACNSYFKQKKTLKEIAKLAATAEEKGADDFDKAGFLAIKLIAKAALKGDTNDSP